MHYQAYQTSQTGGNNQKKKLIIHKSRAFLAPQVLSVVKYHLSLSEYAISDQSNQPNWKE